MNSTVKKVAFIVPEFPATSMTWLQSQITGLIDNGVAVDIYTLYKGSTDKVPETYFTYKLADRSYNVDFPKNPIVRVFAAVPIVIALLVRHPKILVAVLNYKKYGKEALSLKLLFRIYPFVDKLHQYDLIHCHFGTVASKFISVKEILGCTKPHLCTFYGYDISHITKSKGVHVYGGVIQHFDRFLVMSENMKKRVVDQGFPTEKVFVHPISIDVNSYPYKERKLAEGEIIKLSSVGRFVEKKGYNDLLRAMAIVKDADVPDFKFDLIGDGPLNNELRSLAVELNVEDIVDFRGFMKLEDIKDIYDKTHIYVQPSKTAADGDME